MSRYFNPLLILLCLGIALPGLADEAEDREALKIEIEHLFLSGYLSSGDVDIASRDLLAEVYEARDFSPTWNDDAQVMELISLIEATEADGLDPADYHLQDVEHTYRERRSGRIMSPLERAVTDIMLTDSLIRLGYHQLFGKVNPYTLDPDWNFLRELHGMDPAATVQDAIDSPSLTVFLQEMIPRGHNYRQLQAALADYREIAANGGWPQIPDGPTLRPGDTDERIAVLAQRLAITGDAESIQTFAPMTTYDAFVQEGIERFQARHGIEVDGVIGPATLRALNVSAEERVEQLKVNLERARWVTDDLEGDFVLVNIAGFRAYLVRDRETIWEARVQVGTSYNPSPVFRDEMSYLVINPTWTVPDSIATIEMLPEIQQDPDFLANGNYEVTNSEGETIDPSTIDWSQVTASDFGYTFTQRAGPGNALGRVKFMFPNEHQVYLHDTPNKPLFGKAGRAFSHGCIRIEQPFELAELLLGSAGWDQEQINEVLDSGETTNVFLPEPMPVLLLYWTASVGPDGTVNFYNDLYDRDPAIARSLELPFRLEPPEG
jgi:murein L,D-transpeptidase YcbB/YkuD